MSMVHEYTREVQLRQRMPNWTDTFTHSPDGMLEDERRIYVRVCSMREKVSDESYGGCSNYARTLIVT